MPGSPLAWRSHDSIPCDLAVGVVSVLKSKFVHGDDFGVASLLVFKLLLSCSMLSAAFLEIEDVIEGESVRARECTSETFGSIVCLSPS